MRNLLTTALLAATLTTISAGCATEEVAREADDRLELVPITDADALAYDVFDGLRAESPTIGQVDLVWDDIVDPRVSYVQVWRPNMEKWADLAGGEWHPDFEHWGDLISTIPAGPARWIDGQALAFDDNRYILRTVGFNHETIDSFVVEAKPARAGLRAANWAEQDTNGVGTHDINGEYVNVRGDGLSTVLFMAQRGELSTTSYATQTYNGTEYIEVFFKSGTHAGERGWVAKQYLRWTTLDVCTDTQIRTGNNLQTVVGTASRGAQATVVSGTVRNTGTNRYFEVSVGGKRGFVATTSLCPKGQAAVSGGGGGGGGGNNAGGSYDAAAGKRLGDEAYKGSIGYSMGRCYQYAWAAMRRAIGITEARANQLGIPATSAYQFGDWADANPGALLSDFGLKKIDSTAANAPIGSVVVWEPRQCGFNAIHGHIEIVASPGYACSDFCGYMYNDCGKPRVYMPVK